MKLVSRFQKRLKGAETVTLTINGHPFEAQAGDTVAAALLAHSGDPSRFSAEGNARTPYCMMGVCFECRIEIDGRPNMQGCMVTVKEGMVLLTQSDRRHLNKENCSD